MTKARLLRHVAALVFCVVTAVTYPPRVQADSCTELMSEACEVIIYWGLAHYWFNCEFPADCNNMEDCCEQFCGTEPDDFVCNEDAVGPAGRCYCDI